MPVREYAQALGVVLILVGMVGLVLDDQLFLGLLNIYFPKDTAHLLTGSLLAYISFGHTDESLARTAVAALGGVYFVVGVLGFALPILVLGLHSQGYSVLDNVIHLLVGILSLAVYFGSGRNTPSRV
jgi:hypothetical protein